MSRVPEMAKDVLLATILLWRDALNGEAWPEEIEAPALRELFERTRALALANKTPNPEEP